MIQAVLFDADGVVQTNPADWRSRVAALCPQPQQREAFVSELFAAERPALTGSADFLTVLADVLRRWGSTVAAGDAALLWQQVRPAIDVLEIVNRLRAGGWMTALASNQQAYRARFMRDDLGYADRFDRLFFSCELGAGKPGVEFFAAVLARLGVPAADVLFVDDQPANVEAARRSGLAAAGYTAKEGPERLLAVLAEHGVRL